MRVIDGGRGRLLTIRDVAAKLNVSTATAYKLVNAGKLAHTRVGNAIRVEPSDLADFIRAGGERS